MFDIGLEPMTLVVGGRRLDDRACLYEVTTGAGNILDRLYIYTGGGQKKWPSLKIWLMWYTFY